MEYKKRVKTRFIKAFHLFYTEEHGNSDKNNSINNNFKKLVDFDVPSSTNKFIPNTIVIS